jgi:apolipoprotein D and lipocalin family protein
MLPKISSFRNIWANGMKLLDYPTRLKKALNAVRLNTKLLEDGKIEVLNTGRKINKRNKLVTAKGKAFVPDIKAPAKIKVSFFGPFYADYWILALDNDYQYALVGEPSRKYLWILARNTTMPESDFQLLMRIAKEAGFNTGKMIRVKQDC